MEIKGPRTAAAGRLFEALQLTAKGDGKSQCSCCTVLKQALRIPNDEKTWNFAYVEHYFPRSEVMKQLVPKETVAAYIVCVECAETLPEAMLFDKVERLLIDRGLLNTDHKPLNEPGRHSPKTTRGPGGDRRIILDE